jgi:uncharacterized membrane protein
MTAEGDVQGRERGEPCPEVARKDTMKTPRTAVQQLVDATRNEWKSYSKKHAAIQKQAERVTLDDGRQKTLIRCAHCHQLFPRPEMEANHKKPVGKLLSTKAEDIEAYRDRMFCKVGDINALCLGCHRAETAAQRRNSRTLH